MSFEIDTIPLDAVRIDGGTQSRAALNGATIAQKALYARRRSTARNYAHGANYERYEAEKAIWTGANPNSTPEQYDAAVRAIAKACGV